MAAAFLTAAVAVFGIYASESINRSGGTGWPLLAAVVAAIVTLACLVSATCSAFSLLRREPRRTLATVIFVVCGLEVLLVGGSLAGIAVRALGPDPNAAHQQAEEELSATLVAHFNREGIALKPGAPRGGFQTHWFLEVADLNSTCQVRVVFQHFPIDATLDMMRRASGSTIPPMVLNAEARLAMSRPIPSARSANASVCSAWSEKSSDVSAHLARVFESFRP